MFMVSKSMDDFIGRDGEFPEYYGVMGKCWGHFWADQKHPTPPFIGTRKILRPLVLRLRAVRSPYLCCALIYCSCVQFQLVSPEDLVNACKQLDLLKLPVRLRVFESGVMVLQLHSHREEEVIKDTTDTVFCRRYINLYFYLLLSRAHSYFCRKHCYSRVRKQVEHAQRVYISHCAMIPITSFVYKYWLLINYMCVVIFCSYIFYVVSGMSC